MATNATFKAFLPKNGVVLEHCIELPVEDTVFGEPEIVGPVTAGAPSGHVLFHITIPRQVSGVTDDWEEPPLAIAGAEEDFDEVLILGPVMVVQDPPCPDVEEPGDEVMPETEAKAA